jgi:LysM repeat protein
MKNNKIQTKRKTQTGFRAMYARTIGKKVRASAAASADELDGDVPSVGIGKALTVILILHVLAIAAICVGTQWRGDDNISKSSAIVADLDKEEVDEPNEPSNDTPGKVYLDAPASYDLSNDGSGDEINDRPSNDQGLAVEPKKRRPRVIKPRRDPNKPQPRDNSIATVKTSTDYKIQKGDNFYRLAKRYKVKQQELINMNPTVNASRMKIGMIIKVPQN